VTFDEIEAFLVLAEELHFGRTAERLYVSQPRVTRLIAALEAEVGAKLFVRTSRRVELTPLGSELRIELSPAMEVIRTSVANARRSARGITGELRLGFTLTTPMSPTRELAGRFTALYPDCEVLLRECSTLHPYDRLRRGEVDVLVNWLAIDEPDLTAGPVIAREERALAVSERHPFAGRDSIGFEELGGLPVGVPTGLPRELWEAIVPEHTPSGTPIPRTVEFSGPNEGLALVAEGKIVAPTVRSMSELAARPGVAYVPIRDMPPLALGLIWVTAAENARIVALAEIADVMYGHHRVRRYARKATSGPLKTEAHR
jgi:DNA-binding transcriptional LysR family regulator